MNKPCILFSCCGGSGGWSILRSLECFGHYRLVGVDSDPLAAGLYQHGLSASYFSPSGKDREYVPFMLDLVRKEGVQVVWPTSDEEVIALSNHKHMFDKLGAKVIAAGSEVIDGVVDKLACVRRMKEADIPVPLSTELVGDPTEISFPAIVRPKRGEGGKQTYFFENCAELKHFKESLEGDVAEWFVQEDGIFFLDAFGGYEAFREMEESTKFDNFTYIWDQHHYNPIDGDITCFIHFKFPDGSKMKRAFSYHWRLWTLPELQELLLEAGFQKVLVYWEGTDKKTGEGNGEYLPTKVGEADAGWICYLSAEK